MKEQILTLSPQVALNTSSPSRVSSLDIQRGWLMVIMAAIHSLEFANVDRYGNNSWQEPAVWESTSLFDLVCQALTLCASGGFFFLMGLSIVFLLESRLAKGWSWHKICRYLAVRGSFIIFLQISLIQLFKLISEQKFALHFGVLFTLGTCMIIASVLILISEKLKNIFNLKTDILQYLFPLLIAVIILVGLQISLDNNHYQGLSESTLQMLLFVGGNFKFLGLEIDIDFAPLSWLPGVAFGLIFGKIMLSKKESAFVIFGRLAMLCLASWIALRLCNMFGLFHFGDYKFFESGHVPALSSFFLLSKYPPSIGFYLWALGFNLSGIVIWYKLQTALPSISRLLAPIEAFGRSALYFFVVHWYVYYTLGLVIPHNQNTLQNWFFMWILGLIILYMLCQRFYHFKIRQPSNSLWRMF
jgi:hypothetical protein